MNDSYDLKRFLSPIATIITIVVLLAGIIWAGSKIDSKASDAYNFVEANRNLPEKICVLEKKMEKAERVISSFDVMQTEQRHIVESMRGLKDEFVRALKQDRAYRNKQNGDDKNG